VEAITRLNFPDGLPTDDTAQLPLSARPLEKSLHTRFTRKSQGRKVYGSRNITSTQSVIPEGPPKNIKPDIFKARRRAGFELIPEDGTRLELKTVNRMAIVESTPGLILSTHTG